MSLVHDKQRLLLNNTFAAVTFCLGFSKKKNDEETFINNCAFSNLLD